MKEFDVLVLGGGLAGISSALRAAELGGRVCWVEKDHLGQVGFQRRNLFYIKREVLSSVSWKDYRKV